MGSYTRHSDGSGTVIGFWVALRGIDYRDGAATHPIGFILLTLIWQFPTPCNITTQLQWSGRDMQNSHMPALHISHYVYPRCATRKRDYQWAVTDARLVV